MARGHYVIQSALLRGVEAIPVDVEVTVSYGMPGFYIVGMVDAAVQESKERIKAALRGSGYNMPTDRVLVNLAPSSVRKSGSGFDLAIAMGILIATGQVKPDVAKGSLFVGELSLDGSVRSVAGLLAYGICARDHGLSLTCPEDASGLIPIEGLTCRGLRSLADLSHTGFREVGICCADSEDAPLDFGDISGNEWAKRAIQIAAAGEHGLLMMGPPGSGKTMLASRLPSILPPLTEGEKLRAALVHSVAGEDVSRILAGQRPFRAPHHSATAAGLIGGGNPIRPGEISLADAGILFLDELAEYKGSVLQQIRQPLEQGTVSIARADGTVTFPAHFMLVAATNPCACGYYGDPEHECTCTAREVSKYQNRIGGPLMDRIDIQIDVNRVAPGQVLSTEGGITSAELREGVLLAREYASWRTDREGKPATTHELMRACYLSSADRAFFEKMAEAHHMSGRSIVRTIAVARTIADIGQRAAVSKADLCEALNFKIREGVGR